MKGQRGTIDPKSKAKLTQKQAQIDYLDKSAPQISQPEQRAPHTFISKGKSLFSLGYDSIKPDTWGQS